MNISIKQKGAVNVVTDREEFFPHKIPHDLSPVEATLVAINDIEKNLDFSCLKN